MHGGDPMKQFQSGPMIIQEMGGKAKVPPNQRSLNGRYLQRTNEGG